MTQFDQFVTAVAVVAFLFVGAIAVYIRLNERRDTRDPYGVRRMRRTCPRRYRLVVESVRRNSIVLLFVGFALMIVGTLTGAAMGYWLLVIASPLGGGALIWFAFRWCRWAWRMKLD